MKAGIFALTMLMAMSAVFCSSCRTVYIEPELPDFVTGRIDYRQYDMNSMDDLQLIVARQYDIIKGWESFYADLREENKK